MKKVVLAIAALLILGCLTGCTEKTVKENNNGVEKQTEIQVVYQDADTRYRDYLKNLKQSMEKEFSSVEPLTETDLDEVRYRYDYIEPFSPNTVHHLVINDQFELLVNGKIMADHVLKAHAAYEGNGALGFSVYYITEDGTLYFCGVGKNEEYAKISDSWRSKNEIHPLELKNIVDFMDESSMSGSGVRFIDIDGNIVSLAQDD